MSGSVTVVGSSLNQGLAGVLTVSGSFGGLATQTALQTLLTSISGAVTQQGVNFENINVAGLSGNQAATVGGFGTGLFDISNTDSVSGTVSGGSANISVDVPSAYNYIVVQAPGSESVNSSASALLAIFGNQSAVHFNGGGSGTVIAAGPSDFVGLDGGTWSVYAAGDTVNGGSHGDSIQSGAASATITTAGFDNIVGLLGGSSSVNLGGTGDLIETYNSGVTASISVSGANDRVLVDGGSNTVTAVTGNSGLNIFFNLSGGSLDFINASTSSVTVSGAVSGAIGGSVTAFGGAGGGYYIGGPGGNNSLIGGTGLVTLLGSGTNNLESANGAGSAGNWLSVGNSGSSTLIASASTTNNTFFGGAVGTTVMKSSGSGVQTFFVGTNDQESLTGSTTPGAVNDYYFDQTGSGSGSDIITNFRLATDKIFIDTIADQGDASVATYVSHGGANPGSTIFLTDNTSITLYGVSVQQLQNAGIGEGSTTI